MRSLSFMSVLGHETKNPTVRMFGAADFRTSVKPKVAILLPELSRAGCNFACVIVAMLLHRVGSAAKLMG